MKLLTHCLFDSKFSSTSANIFSRKPPGSTDLIFFFAPSLVLNSPKIEPGRRKRPLSRLFQLITCPLSGASTWKTISKILYFNFKFFSFFNSINKCWRKSTVIWADRRRLGSARPDPKLKAPGRLRSRSSWSCAKNWIENLFFDFYKMKNFRSLALTPARPGRLRWRRGSWACGWSRRPAGSGGRGTPSPT